MPRTGSPPTLGTQARTSPAERGRGQGRLPPLRSAEDTGRCITCSRVCTTCGHPVRNKTMTLCRDCSRKTERDAAQVSCPQCDRPGYCARAPAGAGIARVPAKPNSRPLCRECGRWRRHAGLGLCSACWRRHLDRPFVRVQGRSPNSDNLRTGCVTSPPISPPSAASAAPAR